MNKPGPSFFLVAAALLGGCATEAPVVRDPVDQHLVPPAAAADTPPPSQQTPAAATTLEQGIWRPNQPPVLAMQAPRQRVRAVPQMSPLEPPPYAPGYASEHRFYPPLHYTPGIPPPPPERFGNAAEDPCPPGINGGTLAGAVLGGVIGHQLGAGSGRTALTALGAVTGAIAGTRAGGTSPCR